MARTLALICGFSVKPLRSEGSPVNRMHFHCRHSLDANCDLL